MTSLCGTTGSFD